MLYKLRNNAFVSPDKDKGGSDFVYFRKALLPDIAYAEAISRKAQELSAIVEKITGKNQNSATDVASIEETLKILEEQGFVISGNTEEELVKKEIPLYRDISIE